MKLSEAIRIGAMWKTQANGDLLSDDGMSTCAIGAAMDAIGVLTADTFDGGGAIKEWPFLSAPPVRCPACALGDLQYHDIDDLYDNITALNDDHYWPREQIADWVATLEPQSPAAGEAQAVGSVSTVSDAEVLIHVSK